eukprot:TRINITY_DN8240_c0_g2_i1.p1 TRINITY_DN8240_c0_g2~~TRINITY_DN8240_c0_g2_i1.p1  ORF type:complete len:702 (+),score=83.58 TRINITY_DN8240_c0_g2_i1:648-2753(+)
MLESIETRHLPLRGIGYGGIHTYCPVVFTGWNFGAVYCSVHASIINMQCHPPSRIAMVPPTAEQSHLSCCSEADAVAHANSFHTYEGSDEVSTGQAFIRWLMQHFPDASDPREACDQFCRAVCLALVANLLYWRHIMSSLSEAVVDTEPHCFQRARADLVSPHPMPPAPRTGRFNIIAGTDSSSEVIPKSKKSFIKKGRSGSMIGGRQSVSHTNHLSTPPAAPLAASSAPAVVSPLSLRSGTDTFFVSCCSVDSAPWGSDTLSIVSEFLVADFHAAAEGRDPSEYAALLQARFDEVRTDVERYWRTVIDSFVGSHPDAVFSALSQQFFDAERRAAQKRVRTAVGVDVFTEPRSDSEISSRQSYFVPDGKTPCVTLTETTPPLDGSVQVPAASPLLRALNDSLEQLDCPPPSTFRHLRTSSEKDGAHLVVFVHGFKGSHFDLRNFRNYLALFAPYGRCDFLLSKSFEKHPYVSLERMATLLVEEITDNIQKEKLNLRKLSFVCHSMGSVIVRECLRQEGMQPFLPHLGVYVSFSGPHLGTTISASKMVDTAAWVIATMRQAQCLRELKSEEYLLSLSEHDGLGRFQTIILVGCAADTFVSLDSATILPHSKVWEESRKQYHNLDRVLRNLTQRLLCAPRVLRVVVDYGPHAMRDVHSSASGTHSGKASKVDRFTGKTVHTAFLCNVEFMVTFANAYLDHFLV